MRILICIPFPLAEPKGNSVAARRLLAGFTARGAEVRLVDSPAVTEAGVVRQAVEEFRPQVALILHPWRCARAFQAVGDVAPVPRLVSLRGTDLNEMLDDPATRGELGAILDASAAIAVFHEAAVGRLTARKRSWGAKAFVVPNGVRLPESAVDYRSRLGIGREAFVFGMVAGLREVKRPLLVLPWLERLRGPGTDLVWLHAGLPIEPPVARALEEFSEGRPWVRHLDEVPHEEIDSFLRAADVFVAASRSEGMPHAVREAMLARRPCLLSDIEGHRNMAVAEREALYFTDEESFLAQAARLLRDSDLRDRLGVAARARVEADLARADEIAAYLERFDRLVGSRGPTG